MQNIKDFYILGNSIETKIGNLRFLKVRDYPLLAEYSEFLNLEKWEVVNWLRPISKEFSNIVKNSNFIDVISDESMQLKDKFEELFILCFGEDVFCKIETDEELEYYRNLIRQVNCLQKPEKNVNEEIEKFNKLSKMYNSLKNGDLSFESMYTSIWVTLGKSPKDLTLYEFHSLFNRINQFKSYDVSTLYSTVATDVKVEPWYKHIDMFGIKKKETLNEFSNKANKIMK